ncbi:MAG: nucleotidyltransferase family protein [archaeon]
MGTPLQVNTALLLVGGQATRLRPITLTTPKALIPVQGTPITEHILKHLISQGITHFYFSVGYLKEKVMHYFGDGRKWGVKIEYLEENEPLGTAGPLNLLRGKLSSPFLMLNGDVMSKIPVSTLKGIHQKYSAKATITLVRVEDPSSYGVARLAEDNSDRITEFVEKPLREQAPSNLINAGFYLLDPAVLDYVPQGRSMIEYKVFPKLAAEGSLYCYKYSGPWFDVGTPERLKEVKLVWDRPTQPKKSSGRKTPK